MFPHQDVFEHLLYSRLLALLNVGTGEMTDAGTMDRPDHQNYRPLQHLDRRFVGFAPAGLVDSGSLGHRQLGFALSMPGLEG